VAGFQPNPFQFMKHCSCFVLSSNHEGQPMVILEALHLGLQVITTRFSSVDSALPPGVGLVVEQNARALAEGMEGYLQSGLQPVTFDSAAYNAEAMDEFYAALDIPPRSG
jgi:glycosyltransferase involved in cell wall biosynthesis